jgi:uncharacterized protein (DUF2267 family)
MVAREFRTDDNVDPETVARGVFQLLTERVADGEIEDVRHLLPADIRALWSGTRASEPVGGGRPVG